MYNFIKKNKSYNLLLISILNTWTILNFALEIYLILPHEKLFFYFIFYLQ